MSIYQVEQHYIHLNGRTICDNGKAAVEEILSENNCTNYEWIDGGIVIYDFESESDAKNIVQLITAII
jgi:hypothetical protein